MIDISISHAQEQLARTFARARSEEDRDLVQSVREQGAQVAHLLNGLLRMAHTHALNNTAFDQPVAEFERRLASLGDLLGPVTVLSVEDQVYVNDVRIRFDFQIDETGQLGAELHRHNVGGFTFNEAITGEQVRALVRLVSSPPAVQNPRTALQERFLAEGLSSVQALPVFRFRLTGEEAQQVDVEFKSLYLSAAPVVADAFANLGADRVPNPLPARRLVNQLVDAGLPHDVVGQAAEHQAQLPAFAQHTLMASTLAVLVGRNAGLSDASLADLGVAAMFHDVGFSVREGAFSVPYERHTIAGMRVLLRQRGFHAAKLRRLLVVLQHHRNLNDGRGAPTLYARIVHIADDYDILTRYRPGKGPVLSAPDAIARMTAMAGTAYDPLLLQIFVNAMGPYPPGSIMTLSDGRAVVSVSTVRSPQTFDKPLCRVVRMPDGSRPAGDATLDLATARVSIARIHRPSA